MFLSSVVEYSERSDMVVVAVVVAVVGVGVCWYCCCCCCCGHKIIVCGLVTSRETLEHTATSKKFQDRIFGCPK